MKKNLKRFKKVREYDFDVFFLNFEIFVSVFTSFLFLIGLIESNIGMVQGSVLTFVSATLVLYILRIFIFLR